MLFNFVLMVCWISIFFKILNNRNILIEKNNVFEVIVISCFFVNYFKNNLSVKVLWV